MSPVAGNAVYAAKWYTGVKMVAKGIGGNCWESVKGVRGFSPGVWGGGTFRTTPPSPNKPPILSYLFIISTHQLPRQKQLPLPPWNLGYLGKVKSKGYLNTAFLIQITDYGLRMISRAVWYNGRVE